MLPLVACMPTRLPDTSDETTAQRRRGRRDRRDAAAAVIGDRAIAQFDLDGQARASETCRHSRRAAAERAAVDRPFGGTLQVGALGIALEHRSLDGEGQRPGGGAGLEPGGIVAKRRILNEQASGCRPRRGDQAGPAAKAADHDVVEVERIAGIERDAVGSSEIVDREASQRHFAGAGIDHHALATRRADREDGDPGVNARRGDDRHRLADGDGTITARVEHHDLAADIGDRERLGKAAAGRGERARAGVEAPRRYERALRGLRRSGPRAPRTRARRPGPSLRRCRPPTCR